MGILFSIKHSKKIKSSCVECGIDVFYKKSSFKDVAYPSCSRKCAAENKAKRYKGSSNPRSLKLTSQEKVFWDRTLIYKYRSKAKCLEFDLDYKFLLSLFEKQKGMCYYTGMALRVSKGKSFDTMSLDRVDPQHGYIKGNVVFCLNCINMLKSNYRIEDISKVFAAIAAREISINQFSEVYRD